MKINYAVKKEDNNKRLSDVLKKNMYMSNILINKLKTREKILVNNIPRFTNYMVNEGDVITVNLDYDLDNTKFMDKFKLVDAPLDILYEDDYLLIVNKPYNMPVHPSANNYENTLSNIVASYLSKKNIYGVHIVTRLDKNTSGICIFAKHSYIQELFLRKKEFINISKEYIAIVDGIVKKDHDIIQKNISRKEGTIILRQINENGEFARTEYTTLYRNNDKNYSVLNVLLHTGRTHQIRVHFSSISHPLLGDELYANECNIKNITTLIKRQALHCHKLEFNHPITGKNIELISPIPEDMEVLINNII